MEARTWQPLSKKMMTLDSATISVTEPSEVVGPLRRGSLIKEGVYLKDASTANGEMRTLPASEQN